MGELIQFPEPRLPEHLATDATFNRPTPLYDDEGRQLGIAVPGQQCQVMQTYEVSQRGLNSPALTRAKVYYKSRVWDVDAEALNA